MSKKIVLVLLVVGFIGLGYYLISPVFRVVETNEASPLAQTPPTTTSQPPTPQPQDTTTQTQAIVQPSVVARGTFLPHAHAVNGTAMVIQDKQKTTLRFENFDTVNGPDLRIYLATDLRAKDIVDLGPIKATKGNVNYALDRNIDILKYRYVLVWCRAFSVLFSSAELQTL
ncbi:DM13 domain-containing protein [Candidatus Uhrbacteria bacterium]|nr:DM13 domain-containing protein [Candidatus Uhrbacteria bacterium]